MGQQFLFSRESVRLHPDGDAQYEPGRVLAFDFHIRCLCEIPSSHVAIFKTPESNLIHKHQLIPYV